MHDIIRIARGAGLACTLMLVAQVACAGSNLPIASAQPRVPQAVVNNGTLQGYLNAVGEQIDVLHDQVDVGLLTCSTSNNSTSVFQVELVLNPDGVASGIYNGHDAHPSLMQVFSTTASNGWFAVISFRTSPTRAVVNVFDANANMMGTTTYLGADRNAIGFYVQGPGGTFYSQDARNPGAAPQLLFFRGTGINLGAAWLAIEDQPAGSGAHPDYTDQLWFIESIMPCVVCDGVTQLTAVQHANWGELKSRFR